MFTKEGCIIQISLNWKSKREPSVNCIMRWASIRIKKFVRKIYKISEYPCSYFGYSSLLKRFIRTAHSGNGPETIGGMKDFS